MKTHTHLKKERKSGLKGFVPQGKGLQGQHSIHRFSAAGGGQASSTAAAELGGSIHPLLI